MSLSIRRHLGHTGYVSLAACCIVLLLSMPVSSFAQMNEVTESVLSSISAQSGISYTIGNSGYRVATTSYRFSDTDSTPYNWIELNDVTVDDGLGNYFSMDTPYEEADFNTTDVGTDEDGLTSIFMNLSLTVEPRTYTVGDFVFCNQSLGILRVENFRTAPSNKLIVSARNTGGGGINFDYSTELMIDSARFIYNQVAPVPDELNFTGIHMAETVTGDPTTPSLWAYTGKFKFGDTANDNPATIDVGTADNGDGTQTTSVFYNIPMKGSVRMESVNLGGTSFGPCALDGINVHRLGIQIPGK